LGLWLCKATGARPPAREAEQAWPRSGSPNMCGAQAWALGPYHDGLAVPLSCDTASNCRGLLV
jgi:hypothetical protein